MFETVIYQMILGFPLVNWVGIVAFIFMLASAIVAIASTKGIIQVDYNLHPTLAGATIFFAVVHVLMIALTYL